VPQELHAENQENRTVCRHSALLFSLADFCLLPKSTTEVTTLKCSLAQVLRFAVKQGTEGAMLRERTERQQQLFEYNLARHLFQLNSSNDLF